KEGGPQWQPSPHRPDTDPARSPAVLIGFGEFPYHGIQHAAEAQQRAQQREDAVGSSLAVHPLTHEYRDQDGGGQLDPEPGVAERTRAYHGEKLRAYEKIRKQTPHDATLCGAWEYDVLTWSPHDIQPIPHPATVRESFRASRLPAPRRRRAARAAGPGACRPPSAGG